MTKAEKVVVAVREFIESGERPAERVRAENGRMVYGNSSVKWFNDGMKKLKKALAEYDRA